MSGRHVDPHTMGIVKDEIYALYTENECLEEDRVKDTIEYLDDFYELVEDEGDMQREFVRKCRR